MSIVPNLTKSEKTMNNPRSVNSSASPANLDLVENQRQSSSGEFSRIEKRNGATKITFHSKSMPRGCNDKKYDLFRTMSGKLERQISNLRGKPIDTSLQDKEITESLTAERFLEALQGPELETLKVLFIFFCVYS